MEQKISWALKFHLESNTPTFKATEKTKTLLKHAKSIYGIKKNDFINQAIANYAMDLGVEMSERETAENYVKQVVREWAEGAETIFARTENPSDFFYKVLLENEAGSITFDTDGIHIKNKGKSCTKIETEENIFRNWKLYGIWERREMEVDMLKYYEERKRKLFINTWQDENDVWHQEISTEPKSPGITLTMGDL